MRLGRCLDIHLGGRGVGEAALVRLALTLQQRVDSARRHGARGGAHGVGLADELAGDQADRHEGRQTEEDLLGVLFPDRDALGLHGRSPQPAFGGSGIPSARLRSGGMKAAVHSRSHTVSSSSVSIETPPPP